MKRSRVSLALAMSVALSGSACSRPATPAKSAVATATPPPAACEAPDRIARRVATNFETETLHASADGRLVFLQGTEQLLAFDLEGKTSLWRVGSLDSPDVVVPELSMSGAMSALRGDGLELVTVQTHGQIAVLDAATGRVTRARTTSGPVRGLALSADGKSYAGTFTGGVRLFDRALESVGNADGIDEEPKALATSDDGARILVGGRKAALALVEGTATASLRGHRTEISAVAVSRDGAWGASGDMSGRVLVWDLANRKTVAEVTLSSGRPVGALAFAHDGSWFAVGDGSGAVQLHRTPDAALLGEIPLGSEAVQAIRAPSRSCSLIAGLANGDVVVLESAP